MYACVQLHMYLMCACLWRPEHVHLWLSSSGTLSVSLETRSFISLELTSWARLSELRDPPQLWDWQACSYTWLLGVGDWTQVLMRAGQAFYQLIHTLSPARTSFITSGPPCVRKCWEGEREKVQPVAVRGRWGGSAMEGQERDGLSVTYEWLGGWRKCAED